MFSKPKAWLPGGIWRPKNPHSLEHLKYLYNVLCKNQTVTEQNKSLLVETLRSISEILIWGDQNDSSVFDFFLEKNMLAFFLRFMKQKSGRYICVQLLQTLNILFENISNETSVYYLLSNNHINSIIVHKFDFSDEEVMAYYISFLKTLSLKLNKHTIHFFYNENSVLEYEKSSRKSQKHTNDFALYTEAIKFFNHSESMVRIAVRTITLNVYKACQFSVKYDEQGRTQVDEKSMLRYIRDKTAAPYFSNLVWFIGNHILELDACVRHDADHNSRDRLADLVAEHLDHLHYLNDILCLGIDALNEVLTDHLLNRLLIPLYVYSLTKRKKYAPRSDERPHVSSVVSLFLLSQVFLIISHAPLVRQLADIIFNGDIDVCMVDASASPQAGHRPRREFVKPPEPLAQTLESNRGDAAPEHRLRRRGGKRSTAGRSGKRGNRDQAPVEETVQQSPTPSREPSVEAAEVAEEFTPEVRSPGQNSTDEEKLWICGTTLEQRRSDFSLNNRPYLEAVFNALECSENDYEALFALCLLYAMGHNKGINQELLDSVLMPTEQSKTKDHYNISLVEKLIRIISNSCQNGSKVRLATLEMSILLLKQLVFQEGQCYLQDRHLACLEGAREEATLHLRNFYKVWEKSEEIFLDMFEDEYREMQVRPLNVEYLMMDSSILLQPTGTPLTGIDFNKRLPCGEVERARRAIRVFFLLRDLSLTLRGESEGKLPLTKLDECVKHLDVLDLNNSDLIACTIITRDNKKERRFLVIDVLQLILVEPDTRRLGWGVVKFVGFLQDVEVTGDKDDSRSLHVTIHKPSMNIHAKPTPLLSARFVFDDHIRCMAAKQRLTKGRLKARQRKMQMIAQLLELPTHLIDTMYQPSSYAASNLLRGASSDNIAGRSQSGGSRPGRIQSEVVQRSVFASVGHVSGFGAVRERELSSHAGRAVRQSPQPSGSVDSSSSRPSLVHSVSSPVMAPSKLGHVTIIHDDDIEQAEEAQPSPPAGAAQYLTQQGQPSEQQPQGRRSRSGSGSSTSSLQDIPLEDLSVKSKTKAKPSHPAVSKISARRSLSDGDSSRSRSSSYSPVRSRSGSPSIHARSARRERSHSDSSQDSEATSSQSRRRSHGSSYSSPKRRGKQPSPGRRASSHSVTSFTTKPGQSQPDELFPKLESSSEHSSSKSKEKSKGSETSVTRAGSEPGAAVQAEVASHSRTRSGSGPKSLTPAAQPALSLVTDTSNAIKSSGMGSPKLMPPVEPDQIHNITDGGSGGMVQTEATTTSQEGGVQSTLSFVTKSTPVVDTNKVVAQPNLGEQSGQASATDQLTRLARTVSEHYTFPQEAHSMEMTASGAQESVNATDEDKQQAVGWQA